MLTPVQAVTHPDPYPYYQRLVADQPAYFDDTLRCWVFSSAAAVTAALTEPACLVRPAGEPVPNGLVGTAAGEVFGSLVRMTDGPFHDRLKQIVTQALGQVSERQVREVAAERARTMLAELPLNELMFALPAQVVARLCGVDDGSDERAARLIGQFVQCLPATASPDQLAGAARAAEQLRQLMGPLLRPDSAGLLGELVRAATGADWPDQAPLLANGIGLLSQTYDASAGLLGNCVLAVARNGLPTGELAAFVREVARHDSPVHNTRRFLAEPLRLAGCDLDAGESVLLLLAAANRDPAVNVEPARFWPQRPAPALFTFGAAGHGCPGEQLAVGIATAALQVLIEAAPDWSALVGDRSDYRPSGNIRIPVFPATTVALPKAAGSG